VAIVNTRVLLAGLRFSSLGLILLSGLFNLFRGSFLAILGFILVFAH
jgi:hypothetical protein